MYDSLYIMVTTTRSDNRLILTRIEDLQQRLDKTHIEGKIRQQFFIAARTSGDGACGLHALFGNAVDGHLFCENVIDGSYNGVVLWINSTDLV